MNASEHVGGRLHADGAVAAIVLPMIRADLTGQKLTRDFKSSWQFYEELKAPPHETTSSAQNGTE